MFDVLHLLLKASSISFVPILLRLGVDDSVWFSTVRKFLNVITTRLYKVHKVYKIKGLTHIIWKSFKIKTKGHKKIWNALEDSSMKSTPKSTTIIKCGILGSGSHKF